MSMEYILILGAREGANSRTDPGLFEVLSQAPFVRYRRQAAPPSTIQPPRDYLFATLTTDQHWDALANTLRELLRGKRCQVINLTQAAPEGVVSLIGAVARPLDG